MLESIIHVITSMRNSISQSNTTNPLNIISIVITACITAYFTRISDTRKLIYEKRASLYFEFYDEVEEILSNQRLVFNQEYLKMLCRYKPRLKLLTSDKSFLFFEDFFRFVLKECQNYSHWYTDNCPNQEDQPWFNEETDSWESDSIWKRFNEQDEQYKSKHTPTTEEINKHLIPLYTSMRNDLGSNIK